MADVDFRYWDSDTFIAYLEGDPQKAPKCEGVIQAIEKGEVAIITSALTITEVLWLKGKDRITREKSTKIIEFFEHEAVKIINIDRKVAEVARNLVWDFSVRPKDALHLASAIRTSIVKPIQCFDTFDEDLLKLSGKIGTPPLRICIPDAPYQPTIV